MPKSLISLIGAVTLMAGSGIADAQLKEDEQDPALQYDFVARNATVHYSNSSFSGEAQLRYRRGKNVLDFAGDEISTQRTDIGQLVSVIIENIPDLQVVTLTLLIPGINLDLGDSALFESRMIFATHHTTIAGPDLVEGPLQTYRAPKAFAQATGVVFLGDSDSGVIGKVTQSPSCPGPQPEGNACIGPAAGVTVELHDSMGAVAGSAVTDQQGLFAIRVPAGEYTLETAPDSALPACDSMPVKIADRLIKTTVHCDSGIR